jgi:V8-like Glu-specific endopeptidase
MGKRPDVSFLDEHPLNFSRPELPALRDLLVAAYPYEDAARELAEYAGIEVGTFPMHKNMRLTWTELIRVMSKQGKLRTMVERAAGDQTVSAYRGRFAEMLEDEPAVPAPGPDLGTVWWKGDDTNPAVAGKLRFERLMKQRARLVDVEVARQVGHLARSVAKLTLRFPSAPAYATGFLIGPDLILTNHHNVTDPTLGDVQSVTAEFDYEQRFSDKPLVVKGLVESIQKNRERDWAVIRLEAAVDRDALVLGTPFDVGTDDPIIIIHHPNGAFKQFSLDIMAVRYADEHVIQYLADTQKGSSGSPVFNDKMHVIALHHAEVEITVDVNGVKESEWRNQGIRIQEVMEDLGASGIPFVRY